MKRKMSFLLMPFLALGLFGAVQATKDDKAVVANAATQMIGEIDSEGGRTRINGAEVLINFKSKPSTDSLTITPYYFEATKPEFNSEGYYNNFMNMGTKIAEYNPIVLGGGYYFTIPQGFPDDSGMIWSFKVEYSESGIDYAGIVWFHSNAYYETTAAPTKLGEPTDASIDGNILTFTHGKNADNHSVQYLKDGNVIENATEINVTSPHTLKGLDDGLEAGTYAVQVRSHLEEEVSKWIDAGDYVIAKKDAVKLDAPTNVHVTNGKLEFDVVENAAYYLVEYVKDGSTFTSENAEESPYELNKSLKAGSYTIRVKAMNGDNPDFIPSDYAEAPEVFEIESSVILVKFTLRTYYGPGYATVGLKWEGDVSLKDETDYYTVNGKESRFFDWFAGENNRAGNFQIGDDGSQAYYEFCFYNAAGELIANGALINNVPAPTAVKINSAEDSDKKTLTFDSFKYADRYSLQYLKASDDSVVDTEYSVESGYVLKDLEPGSYKVQVRAHIEGYTDSEWAEADKIYEIAAEGAEQLATPTNVKVEGDKLYFDTVANATHYSVEYSKEDYSVTETAYESPYTLNSDLKAGEYTIRVCAMNDDPSFVQSEYVEADGKFVVEFVPVELTITLRAYYGENYATLGFNWDDPEFSLYDEIHDGGYYTVNGRESRFFAWFGGEGNKAGNFEIGDNGSQASYEFLFYNAAGVLVARGVLVNEVVDTVGQFIADWHKMREDGGDNGICAFLTDSENATLKALLDRFMAFSPEEQEAIRLAADVDTITIGQTMDYMASMQSWVSDALGTNGSGLNGVLLTANSDSAASIAIVAVMALIAISGYYFVQKKKFVK
ncbi:MAG: fibronectin type III domain-containing protein [Erysipelotrichales bacterium]|nr:fibronectin type III domain-containing protein [Erysipelotrichales bacterium]